MKKIFYTSLIAFVIQNLVILSNVMAGVEGMHVELDLNTSIFSLNGNNGDYTGYLIIPELRLRKKLDFGSNNSYYVSVGYEQISQFSGKEDEQSLVTKREETPYMVMAGFAHFFSRDNTKDDVSFGFNHIVAGVGYGNFEIEKNLNHYDDGFFMFIGFTITALGMHW